MKYLSLMSTKTKIKCAGIILLAFAGAFLASLWPVLLGNFFSGLTSGTTGTFRDGVTALTALSLMCLSAESITILRRVLMDCIIASHESELRSKTISKLLKMPVSYYAGTLSGEKTAQLNQGVSGLSQLIKVLCSDVFTAILTAACTLIQVFFNAPPVMVLIMLAYLASSIAISFRQIRSQNGIREDIVAKKNALDGQICQFIANLELIRSMHAESYEANRLKPSVESICATEKRHHKYMGTFDELKNICKILFLALLLGMSLALFFQGRMAAGAGLSVTLLFLQLIKPIDDVYRFMDETASSAVKAKPLLELTSGHPDPVFDIPSSSGRVLSDEIKFKHVSVTNPGRTKVLAEYEDLSLPTDKKVALKGPSGCGKTTLIRCLNRYYPYTRGHISFLGRDLDQYSQKELSELLYYVPQSAFFFSGTIRENLIYGLERDCTDSELLDTLEKVCLTGSFKGALGERGQRILERNISEGAGNLSGGQRQRLALARAFLRTPRLYALDESTAGLDEHTADLVLTNFERHAATSGAGILYISHDSNVVGRCDVVIEISNSLNNTAEKEAKTNENAYEQRKGTIIYRERTQAPRRAAGAAS